MREPRYPGDCERICEVALKHGYRIAPRMAELIWEEHSDCFAAGWLHLPEDDDDIWRIIESDVCS
jgi:hypothetical protein